MILKSSDIRQAQCERYPRSLLTMIPVLQVSTGNRSIEKEQDADSALPESTLEV